jgi:hypothetical protein
MRTKTELQEMRSRKWHAWWASLTPEEQQQWVAKIRAHWTPEKQFAAASLAMKHRWQRIPPGRRSAILRERRRNWMRKMSEAERVEYYALCSKWISRWWASLTAEERVAHECKVREATARALGLRLLTDADREEIKRRRLAGELAKDVAQAFGINVSTVHRIITVRPHKRMPSWERRGIVAALQGGMSTAEVARKFNRSITFIRNIAARCRPTVMPRATRDQILVLWRGGMRPCDIARQYGITSGRVRYLTYSARQSERRAAEASAAAETESDAPISRQFVAGRSQKLLEDL